MRHATLGFAALIALALGAMGCADSVEETSTTISKTGGGESVAVGPSRVAQPLPEAGPRANYPGEQRRVGQTEPFDVPGDRDDPMMEEDLGTLETDHAAPLATDEVREMAPQGDTAEGGPPACLGALAGLSVEVTDVYDGAAIVVTGRAADLAEIRDRARVLADATAHTPQVEGSAVGKPAGAVAVDMPPTEVRVIDLARGVRLQYLADDPQEVIQVRNAVRRLASDLRQGRCPGLAAPPTTR